MTEAEGFEHERERARRRVRLRGRQGRPEGVRRKAHPAVQAPLRRERPSGQDGEADGEERGLIPQHRSSSRRPSTGRLRRSATRTFRSAPRRSPLTRWRASRPGASIIHAHCNPVGGPDVEVAERYLEAFEPVWEQRADALALPDRELRRRRPQLRSPGARWRRRDGCGSGCSTRARSTSGAAGEDGRLTGAFVYQNSFDRIGEIFELHEKLRLGPSLAIYEPGFLRGDDRVARGRPAPGRHDGEALPVDRPRSDRRTFRTAADGCWSRGIPRNARAHRPAVGGLVRRRRPRPQRGRQARAAPRRPPAPGPGVLRRRPPADERRPGRKRR